MLPVASSSIQKRRQAHRRQQSLEAPIIATPLPRRANSTRPTQHRRGLSFDQALGSMASSAQFRPLLPQDYHGPPPGHPSMNTNTAYHRLQDQQQHQHYNIKQEPQSQSLPPALTAPQQAHPSSNFQSHLHQQLNGPFIPTAVNSDPSHAAAMQSLQSHIMWYEQNFGRTTPPPPNVQNQPMVQVNHPVVNDMNAQVYMSQAQMQGMPPTPMSHSQARTVPNTPQHHAESWPSPSPSHAKHSRSQSYQLDVAPMPPQMIADNFSNQGAMYSNGASFSFASEQDYAASAYSSSIADPSSPPHQHSASMPTLYEEPSANLLLQATAGAEHDFNSPHFMVGGGSMCPEQAALDAAGIDATYIDTGITEEQINSWLIHPTGKGEPYRCKWEGCDTAINRKENARSHVQNHLDDRRFRCNPCGKRFNRLHDTKRHHLTHTNERPAICPCGKTFARADALTRHRQRDMCEGVLPGFEKAEDEKPKRGRPKKDRSGDDKRSGRPDMESRMRKAHMARSMDRANESNSSFYDMAASISSVASPRSLPDTPPQDADEMNASDFLDIGNTSAQFSAAAGSWVDTPPTSPPSGPSTDNAKSRVFIDFSIPEEPAEVVSPSKLSVRSSPPAPSRSHHDSPMAEQKDSFGDYTSPARYDGFTGGSSPYDGGVDIFNDSVSFEVLESHPDVGRAMFSPPGESCSGSSVHNYSDYDGSHAMSTASKPLAGMTTIPEYGQGMMTRNVFNLEDFMNAGDEDAYGEVRDMLDSWIASN